MSTSVSIRCCIATLLLVACNNIAAPPALPMAGVGAPAASVAQAETSAGSTPAPPVKTAPAGGGGGSMAAGSAGAANGGSVSVAGSGGAAEPEPAIAVVPSGPSGLSMDAATGELIFRTEAIDLPAGKEDYLCFAATLDHDVVVDGFAKGMQSFVHHIQFVKTLAPEPEGTAECNVLFRITWLPIFLAGAGPSELRLDEGVGHQLPSGTQLMSQLHLLNASDGTIHQQVEIRMHLSSSPNPTPVSPWAIGSSDFMLAPMQAGRAQNVCTVKGQVDLVAVFPHMHLLGTKLTVETGKTLDAMSPLYKRDPYSFDDQHMEKFKASLQDGDQVRVTCDYVNTTNMVATFGESTHDEMCFFIGYALGEPPLADCGALWDPVFAELLK